MSVTAAIIVWAVLASLCGLAPAFARRFAWACALFVVGLVAVAIVLSEPLIGVGLWVAALLGGFIVASRAKREDYRERMRQWEHETLVHEMRYGKRD